MGGAILTIRTGSKKSAFALINALKYAKIATNIGDVRTLVIHPASTIYSHAAEERKRAAGVFDDLVRVSVGLEDAEDLKDDFSSALMKSREAGD
jgi:O-acetylhomoserine (thiol)-lyase